MTMMASNIFSSRRGIADLNTAALGIFATVPKPGTQRAVEQRTLTSTPSLTTALRRELRALASDCSRSDDVPVTSRWDAIA